MEKTLEAYIKKNWVDGIKFDDFMHKPEYLTARLVMGIEYKTKMAHETMKESKKQ
jgi:hypothetical protein